MARIDDVMAELSARPRTWVVTGGAGFIGSHLVEKLLGLRQHVRVIDSLVTGRRENLAGVLPHIQFVEGDINDTETLTALCAGADVVLHQAALGSVPRSLADPMATWRANADGFASALWAAQRAGVPRFVYASSSSVYGDDAQLPKREERIGNPLSPYAATKRINEITARTFQDAFGIATIGLRYFNVFGPRQDPDGPYAAVVPRFIQALWRGDACEIFGDGETSRDFCYVDNAVQANLLAALAPAAATGQVFNVACGERTTLNHLHAMVRDTIHARRPTTTAAAPPRFLPARAGDVRHSLADISHARALLGYSPSHDVRQGLAATVDAAA